MPLLRGRFAAAEGSAGFSMYCTRFKEHLWCYWLFLNSLVSFFIRTSRRCFRITDQSLYRVFNVRTDTYIGAPGRENDLLHSNANLNGDLDLLPSFTPSSTFSPAWTRQRWHLLIRSSAQQKSTTFCRFRVMKVGDDLNACMASRVNTP
jgi:hypothetical protein